MNPQGWFQSVLGFPNQSSLKLSQVSQHPQQSKYPSLFYPACATRENGLPPFSAMQSLRHSFSFLPGPPTQLVQNLNAGTLRTRSCEKNRVQAHAFQTCKPPGHGWITPVTTTTNYPMANSSAARFPFPSQDADEDGSMEESGGAWECVREKMSEGTGNQWTSHQSNPPIRPEVGLSNFMGEIKNLLAFPKNLS
jgi:hypothetical protein